MKTAFLFDNDGVLVDTSEFHWRSWQLLMKEESRLVIDRDQFTQSFGKRNDLILKELVPHIEEKTCTRWAARKEELFRQIARGNLTLMAGMESFLKALQEADIPRIIASSTPPENLQMFLSSTPLGNYFTHFISAEEVVHGKPEPDIFIAAAKHLGFEPEECIVIEDAPAGIQAAKAAGSFVIALATSHSSEALSNYNLIYPSGESLNLQEILHQFKVWKNQLSV